MVIATTAKKEKESACTEFALSLPSTIVAKAPNVLQLSIRLARRA